MKTHIFAIFVVAAALCLGIPMTWAQHSAHVMITPSELKWSDVPSLPPGATIAVIEGSMNEPVPFTVRIRFPANYKLPAHWHPAVERITVLSGTFNMGVAKDDPFGSWKCRDHTTEDPSLRVDQGRNSRSTEWSWTLGHHLHQPQGRPEEEVES